MAKGELENRDEDELGWTPLPGMGELSEELSEERGDLDSYSTRQLAGDVPADVQVGRSATDAVRNTGIGSPAIDFQVRSTFDSRPVNGRDFNIWVGADKNSEIGHQDFELTVFNKAWQVPRGLVAVLRAVTILQVPGDDLGTLFDGTLQIMIDNVVKEPPTVRLGPSIGVPGGDTVLSQEPIPYHTGVPVDTFLIADENLFVGVDINPILLGFQDNYNSMLRVGFHGTFLQKTGVPAQFQIANKAGQAYAAETVAPQSFGGGGPSGSDFLVKRRKRVSPFARIPLVNAPK